MKVDCQEPKFPAEDSLHEGFKGSFRGLDIFKTTIQPQKRNHSPLRGPESEASENIPPDRRRRRPVKSPNASMVLYGIQLSEDAGDEGPNKARAAGGQKKKKKTPNK